jgi:MipA family protein
MKALGTRKLAPEVGGNAGIRKTGVITSDYDSLSFRVAFVHDVSGVNDSYVITPTIDYGTPLSRKFDVGVSVSAAYAGTNYAHTYFDVDASGSLRSGLPVFTGHRGWKNVVFGVLGDYALTGDLTHGLGMFVVASYSRLENDFAASPVTSIAGSPDQLFGAVWLGYTF